MSASLNQVADSWSMHRQQAAAVPSTERFVTMAAWTCHSIGCHSFGGGGEMVRQRRRQQALLCGPGFRTSHSAMKGS